MDGSLNDINLLAGVNNVVLPTTIFGGTPNGTQQRYHPVPSAKVAQS